MRRGYNQLWLEWTQRCDSQTIKIHLDCSKLVEGEWLQGRSAESKRLKIDHDLAQGRFSIHAVASVERKRGLIVCILQSDLHMPCRLRVWIWPKTVTEGQDQQYRWNQSGTASRAVIKGNMERQQLLRRTGKSSHYVRSVNVISGCGWWSCHSSILQFIIEQEKALRSLSSELPLPSWALMTLNTRSASGSMGSAFMMIHAKFTALIQTGRAQSDIFGRLPNVSALFDRSEYQKSSLLSQWAASMVHGFKLQGLCCFSSNKPVRCLLTPVQVTVSHALRQCTSFGMSYAG